MQNERGQRRPFILGWSEFKPQPSVSCGLGEDARATKGLSFRALQLRIDPLNRQWLPLGIDKPGRDGRPVGPPGSDDSRLPFSLRSNHFGDPGSTDRLQIDREFEGPRTEREVRPFGMAVFDGSLVVTFPPTRVLPDTGEPNRRGSALVAFAAVHPTDHEPHFAHGRHRQAAVLCRRSVRAQRME